ncbi:MAG: hypothetical protein ACPIOQ_71305, partial [Promethearchaeia archaeon]
MAPYPAPLRALSPSSPRAPAGDNSKRLQGWLIQSPAPASWRRRVGCRLRARQRAGACTLLALAPTGRPLNKRVLALSAAMSPRPRTEEEGNRARGSASTTVVLTDETLHRMAPSRRWLCTATVVAMFAIALGGSVSAEDGAVRPAAETLWKMDPRTGQWVEANDLTWVRGYDREGRPLKDIKPEDYVTGNDLFPRRARDRYAPAAPALADVSSPSRRETHQHPRRDATREGVPGGYAGVAPAGRLAEEGAQPA